LLAAKDLQDRYVNY